MRLIKFFSLAKKQIKLEMELLRKKTQYKLMKCCQFTTKDEEGKVSKYCWNTAFFFFFRSNFSHYKMTLGNHWSSFCTLSFTVPKNNPHGKP